MEPTQRLEESKVVGSIVCPLHSHQVKHLQQRGLLPQRFANEEELKKKKKNSMSEFLPDDGEDGDGNDDELLGGGNLNRRAVVEDSDSD